MIAVDTSLLVAGLCTWHVDHEQARPVLAQAPWLPVHVHLETYATLTRLPAPQRMAGRVAAELLEPFRDRLLTPDADATADLPRFLARHGFTGGASYDALVALGATQHDRARTAESVTAFYSLDTRARRVYDLFDLPVTAP